MNDVTLKKKPILSRKAKRTIFIVVMLAYPLTQFILFFGYVNLDSIALTFQSFSWTEGKYVFVGFQNYKIVIHNILTSESTKRMLLNSFSFIIVNSFIILPLSILFSYFLFKKIPLSGFFRVVFFLPSILPIVVLTMTFSFLFDSNLGPVNSIITTLFNVPVADLPSWFGSYPTSQYMIIVYCIWAGLGFNILLLSGAISRIPKELIEYGELEGVGVIQELRYIVIPLIWPTITTTFVLGLTAMYTVMMQPLLLTPENPNTTTLALSIYNSVIQNGSITYFATLGLFLSLLGAPIIMLIRNLLSRIYSDVDF